MAKYIIITIAIVMVTLIFCICFKRTPCDQHETILFDTGLEIEPKFIITKTDEIIFSGSDSGSYSLYKLGNNSLEKITSDGDYFTPFFVNEAAHGLKDNNGNEHFIASDVHLSQLLGNKPIQFIQSFRHSEIIAVQLKSDDRVLLVNPRVGSVSTLLSGVRKLHAICMSEDEKTFVTNYDERLSLVKTKEGLQEIELATNSAQENMTPFLFDDIIYYSNNEESEYFQIYSINLNDPTYPTALCYKTNSDLKMPKVQGNNIYFMEITNGEYLLRKSQLDFERILPITNRGVVYYYDFLDDRTIILSYSDMTTPKSIFKYDGSSRTLKNISGSSVKSNIKYDLATESKHNSSAYILSPAYNQIHGVILYFHPGLHGDFSPRWDSILMTLCANGYIIVAPNSPMSNGFGKTYRESKISNALDDTQCWKEYIKSNFSDYPIFYLASSSGSILMEQSISRENKDVLGIISMFGMQSDVPNDIEGLYFLGLNDPIVQYDKAKLTIGNMQLVTYHNEGHWIRRRKNFVNLITTSLNFLCENGRRWSFGMPDLFRKSSKAENP